MPRGVMVTLVACVGMSGARNQSPMGLVRDIGADMTVVVCIHGILTDQVDASWSDRFQAWSAVQGYGCTVLKKEYGAGPFPLWNKWVVNPIKARSVVNELLEYPDTARVCFVGHSNGTDICLRAIKKLVSLGRRVDVFVSVASIMESDIERNGIWELISGGGLNRAVAYCSRHDDAVRFGRHSLGYGGLGYEGWTLCGREFGGNDAIRNRWYSNRAYGHGTYWEATERATIFETIARDMRLVKR